MSKNFDAYFNRIGLLCNSMRFCHVHLKHYSEKEFIGYYGCQRGEWLKKDYKLFFRTALHEIPRHLLLYTQFYGMLSTQPW